MDACPNQIAAAEFAGPLVACRLAPGRTLTPAVCIDCRESWTGGAAPEAPTPILILLAGGPPPPAAIIVPPPCLPSRWARWTSRAKAFAWALYQWWTIGFLLESTERVREIMRKACRPCRHWHDWRAFGVRVGGHCDVCGCSNAKQWLASSRCPLPTPGWDNRRPELPIICPAPRSPE